MTFPIHSFRDLRRSTLSLILLVAFAGSPDAGATPPRQHGQPAGLGGGSLRRPAREIRHGDLR